MSSTAIILPPSASSYLVVAGVPLIQRIAISARRAGFDQVVAVAGDDEARLRRLLEGDSRTTEVRICAGSSLPIENGNGFALLPSDHLLTSHTLEHIRSFGSGGGPRLFQPPGASNGNGVIVAGPGATDDEIAHPERVCLHEQILFPVPDQASVSRAESQLVSRLAAETAATDGPIARLDRAVSTRISGRLIHTPLRPNHITIVGTAVGMIAAWVFAQGTYRYGVLGAFLFWCAVIIDGCDGEVARLKLLESHFGYLFDVITDNLVHLAIFAGIGIGQLSPARALWLVPILLVGFLCATAATYFCLIRDPPSDGDPPATSSGAFRRRLLGGFEALMNRDFAYLIVVLALIGRIDWFLWGAAFGTYVYAATLFAVYRGRGAE
jgi:phosphatidylglycerophosphate synthase